MSVVTVAFGAVAYCLCIGLVLTAVCFPSIRDRWWKSLVRLRSRVPASVDIRSKRLAPTPSLPHEVVALRERRLRAVFLFGAASALALTIVLLTYLRGTPSLDGYGVRRADNTLALALLEGEQLVPPPPLAPQVFATTEVLEIRPMISDANRDWELLQPEFRQRLLRVFKEMQEEHGYQVVLLEGFRSRERQEMLANSVDVVTNARGFQSYHQFGLAADCAFFKSGKLIISERDPWAARGYELLGAAARSAGLQWGGDWKTLVDLGHVELSR